MIPDFKTYIGESVWSDILHRNSGKIIRKEDDINHLDVREFIDYLKDMYEVIEKPTFFDIVWWHTNSLKTRYSISVPIEKNNYHDNPGLSNRMLLIEIDTQKKEYKINVNKSTFLKYPNELRQVFGDKYDLDVKYYKIIPKNGKIDNQVCVDVIDRLLGMVERPVLKKK